MPCVRRPFAIEWRLASAVPFATVHPHPFPSVASPTAFKSSGSPKRSPSPVAFGNGKSTAVGATITVPPSAARRVLYSANAGDARGVLCRAGKAVRLTYDQAPPHRPREYQRQAEVHTLFPRARASSDGFPQKSTPARVPSRFFTRAPSLRETSLASPPACSLACLPPCTFARAPWATWLPLQVNARTLSFARLLQSTCAHALWAPQLPSFPRKSTPARAPSHTLDRTASLASPHPRRNARARSLVHLPSRTFARSSWATRLPSQVGTDARIPAHLPSHTSGYVASSQVGVTRWGVRRGQGLHRRLSQSRARPRFLVHTHLALTLGHDHTDTRFFPHARTAFP
ncbi:hypothetical protein DFH08DRAFT_65415 [Mycena albidolilacea]|uniref:PPM-type phosphatase domain-containing protein n=1 Tax=Mycena albidolilacea TaxID=1033008 RepID=A0AAD7AAF5_9AGAR|nr:hypothetical protein DFH08DRAFT_65415 [Mycena albidolilacea]